MKTTPFWTEDYPRPASLAVGRQPSRADVAVVGSGYTGLHAALTLAKTGADVVVLETETIGFSASSRNGGMMTTGLKESIPALAKRYGMERGRALWEWALASIDHVEETVRAEQIDCDFARCGHLLLAAKPSHVHALHEELEWFVEQLDYRDLSFVGADMLATEIGAQTYHGALVDRRSAAVHPAKYVFGLAEAAARRGVKLVEHAAVTGLVRENGGFRLTTPQGDLRAREVLLATNGYTTDVAPYVRRGVFPVGSYIITTPPLPPALQAKLSPRGRMFFDSKHFLNYFRLTPDGRMLFGGRHNLSTRLDLAESARLMQRRMVEVFPQLAGTPITHTWTGKLGLTFDLMPHAGRIPEGPHQGAFYAYGYAGHGVSVASYLGHEMGEVIAGRRGASLLAELPQQRYFFTRYDRLYLPLVSSWFRMLDWMS